MNNGPAIVMDGVKITPEFISLIKMYFVGGRQQIEEMKDNLFMTQSAIMCGIVINEGIPKHMEDTSAALNSLYHFTSSLGKLIDDGKFNIEEI